MHTIQLLKKKNSDVDLRNATEVQRTLNCVGLKKK